MQQAGSRLRAGERPGPDTARRGAAARAQATGTGWPAIAAHAATGRADAADHGHARRDSTTSSCNDRHLRYARMPTFSGVSTSVGCSVSTSGRPINCTLRGGRTQMAIFRIRPGLRKSDPNPTSRRSLAVRCGARWRGRCKTSSCCLSRRCSAITARTPPGPHSGAVMKRIGNSRRTGSVGDRIR